MEVRGEASWVFTPQRFHLNAFMVVMHGYSLSQMHGAPDVR